MEGLAVGRREKPGDVPEAGEDTVHVTSLAIREHLVDANLRQPLRACLQGVKDRQRLGVKHTDNDVIALADVFQHCLWLTLFLG